MMFVAGPQNQKFASSVTKLWTGLIGTMKTSGDEFIGRGFQLKAICFINNKASSYTSQSHTHIRGPVRIPFPYPFPWKGRHRACSFPRVGRSNLHHGWQNQRRVQGVCGIASPRVGSLALRIDIPFRLTLEPDFSGYFKWSLMYSFKHHHMSTTNIFIYCFHLFPVAGAGLRARSQTVDDDPRNVDRSHVQVRHQGHRL